MCLTDMVCYGYNYDSTTVRRSFDCSLKVIKVTVTNTSLTADPSSAVTLTYLFIQPTHTKGYGHNVGGRRMVVAPLHCSRMGVERRTNNLSRIEVEFCTGAVMGAVPRYPVGFPRE